MKNRIKEVRIKKGITQKQLADKLRITRQGVSSMENSESVTMNTLEKVAIALECGVFELLDIEPPKKGETVQIKTVDGHIKEIVRLTGEESSAAIKQVEIDADYFKRLAVPALKLNEIGRKVLLDNAESLAANEDMTK